MLPDEVNRKKRKKERRHIAEARSKIIQQMEQYYYLKKGDVIQENDEVDVSNEFNKPSPCWIKTICIGHKAPDPSFNSHRKYRRKIINQCNCKMPEPLEKVSGHSPATHCKNCTKTL